MDPYWQSPEQEASRLERIRKGILLHVKNPSQIMFYVAKSMNDNIVLFEFSENSYVKKSNILKNMKFFLFLRIFF